MENLTAAEAIELYNMTDEEVNGEKLSTDHVEDCADCALCQE